MVCSLPKPYSKQSQNIAKILLDEVGAATSSILPPPQISSSSFPPHLAATMALSPLPAKPKGVAGFDAVAAVLTRTFFKEKTPSSSKSKQPNAKQATQIAFKELKANFRKPLNGPSSKTSITKAVSLRVADRSQSPAAVASALTPPRRHHGE